MEQIVSFKERQLRDKAIKSIKALFNLVSDTRSSRVVIFTLRRLIIDGNRLKKYAVACLLPDAAAKIRDESFKKVIFATKFRFFEYQENPSSHPPLHLVRSDIHYHSRLLLFFYLKRDEKREKFLFF